MTDVPEHIKRAGEAFARVMNELEPAHAWIPVFQADAEDEQEVDDEV